MDPKLLDYLLNGGWIAFVVFVLFVVLYYERVGIILSDLYELLAWTGKFFQKKYVAQEITSRVKLAVKKLNRETKGLMPFSLEIRWVNPAELNRESFIKENKVVLRLDYYMNQEKNLVNVVQEFVSTAHLREPKSYLSEPLRRCLDLSLTARYLKECGRREALSYFVEHVLRPALEDREVQETYSKLEALDEFGYFTRVLLTEFLGLAARLYPQRVGLPEILDETSRFVDFLCTFPPRPPGGEIELDFRGKYIKVRFVLVAKTAVFAKLGTEPYVSRIAEALSGFADTVYVCGMDKLIGAASRVAKQAKEEYGLTVDAVHHYGAKHHGKLRSAVAIRLRSRQAG